MWNRLLPLGLLLATSCVAVSHRTPTALVDLEIRGEPVILPGGPSIYVDDVYRGNPVDERFRLFLTEGEHEVRLMGGSEVYWEGAIAVDGRAASQRFLIRYEPDGTGTVTAVE